jgi:hypothetical protein
MEWVMEHRWGERRSSNVTVYLRSPNGLAAKGCIRDVSVSGALVITPMPVTLDGHICVYFPHSRGTRHANITAKGQVIRRLQEGFAIEWNQFAPETVRALIDTVAAPIAPPSSFRVDSVATASKDCRTSSPQRAADAP